MMRNLHPIGLLVLAWACLAPTAAEAFLMPKSVFRMHELDEAKAEAKEKGKAITFVYTREETTCGLCVRASLSAVDELKSKSVIVYAHTDETAKLPAAVQQALRSPEAGGYIPKVVLVDANMDKVLAVVPYARGDRHVRLLKDAKKTIPKVEPATPAGLKPLAAPGSSLTGVVIPRDENRPQRTWVSRSGKSVLASLVEQRKDVVVLKTSEGSLLEIPAASLSDLDQAHLRSLRNPTQTTDARSAP
jgi:hypothetical protein